MSPSKKLTDIKIDALRGLGKFLLPDGYWENPKANSKAECHFTFDDGPNPKTTEPLLELLNELSLKATFFVTGKNARAYPKLIAKIQSEGHQLGNHSFGHELSFSQSADKFVEDIDITNNIIADYAGTKPILYRPPYGVIDQRKANLVKDMGLELIYWGALAEDWQNIGSSEVTRRILNQLEPGTIIVLHENADTLSQTLEATKKILTASKEKQLSFSIIDK